MLCNAFTTERHAKVINISTKEFIIIKRSIMINQLLKVLLLPIFTIVTVQNVSAQQLPCAAGGDQGGNFGGGIVNPFKVLFDWIVRGYETKDPNEIRGQEGYAQPKWVSIKDRLTYTIHFENDGAFANAPAQNVMIYLKVNPQININSFKLTGFGFGSHVYYVPDTAKYTTRLNLTDSLGIYVDVTSGIDVVNNDIFWFFKSIDPATGQTPRDARGFLAASDTGAARISDTTRKGQGYVTFSIMPSANLNTGDTLPAQASIVFDVNEAMLTNIWTNTIDAVGPTSRITSGTSDQDIITINWTGQDDAGGSGIRDYALYYSENGGPYILYKDRITGPSTIFAGTPGNSYCFYTIATDNTGNRETPKKTCEFTIGSALPVTWLYFKGQAQVKDVLLTWTTASEKNSKEFIIERSVDGTQFTAIGSVASAGNSLQTNTYTYTDAKALLLPVKMLYYRLKQTDIDGHFIYSSVVTIPVPRLGNEPAVLAYPNPFTQNITLQLVNITASDENDRIALYSLEGKLLYQKRFVNTSNTTVLLNDLPNLTPGVYTLQAVLNNKMYTIKMVRQ